MELLDQLFRSPEVEKSFSSRACLQGMLDFEAALARAEAKTGVIPSSAAKSIAAKCKAELFDAAAIAQGAKLAGNLAIPLVKVLTAQVAAIDKDAARYVHWGATSQDAIDTGLVLQLRDALKFIDADLARVIRALENLAIEAPLDDHGRTDLDATGLAHDLRCKGGGVVGRFATQRRAPARNAPASLGIAVWRRGGNARGPRRQRGRSRKTLVRGVAAWLATRSMARRARSNCGSSDNVGAVRRHVWGKLRKILRCWRRREIGELAEPSGDGRGGSSTMPHKRNPVTSAVVLSAATRVPGLVSTMLSAMVQENERGLGGWHAEWETLPEIVRLAAGALYQMAEMLPRLEVDAERMRQNLEATRGLIYAEAVSMALAEKIGKAEAHKLIEAASGRALKQKRHFRDILSEDSQVTKHLTRRGAGRIV